MNKLNFESNVLRPCFVNGKKKRKGLFHRWYEYNQVLEPSLLVGGTPGGQISVLYAVVEFEDGHIGLVNPTSIIFVGTENKMKDYDFGEVENGACR